MRVFRRYNKFTGKSTKNKGLFVLQKKNLIKVFFNTIQDYSTRHYLNFFENLLHNKPIPLLQQ